MIDLIYCADGNSRFAQIAIDAGYKYGARLPGTIYHPLHFADQNWKAPDRELYIAALRQHRPRMATVLDWERDEQLSEVLAWAEDAAEVVETVIIIPKVHNGIIRLPRHIGGKEVRLGYSVPTAYGGTEVFASEFIGWPVHLLGGSPERQTALLAYFDVNSADGNYAQKMALRFNQFWVPGTARGCKNRYWPQLQETDGGHIAHDAPYEAFARSCANILKAWSELK